MRRSKWCLLLGPFLLLLGCKSTTHQVYIDLNEVVREDPAPVSADVQVPKPPSTRPMLVETIPGDPAATISDPANIPKRSVQSMFEAEQAKSFAALQRRLRQFYESEIQGFRLQQEKAITGEEQAAYETANKQIRPIFERWASMRAPKVARLATLAGFPDPNPESKPLDQQATLAAQKRAAEARQIRIDLKAMDAEFQAKSKSLLNSLLEKSAADQAALRAKIEAFATQLDERAESEARSQVRNATSKLSFQLAKPTPINLSPTSARHLTIPAEKPLEPAPEVPSSGILTETADRKRLLERELRIWLALNGYTLTATLKGHRNATKEFQLWRQQHGAGP